MRFLEKEVEKYELKQREDSDALSALEARYASLDKTHRNTLEYKREVEATLNAKEEELAACQRMIEEQTEAQEKSTKELSLVKSRRDELRVDLERSEAACEARVTDLHQSRVQCEELVRSKATLVEELRAKKLAHEDTTHKLEAAESELERLKQWHVWLKQAEQERLQEQRTKHHKEVEDLRKQMNEMRVMHERVVSQHSTEKSAREVVESQMHKLEQDAWVRASELKSLHKEQQVLVEDNKRLNQVSETLRASKDKLVEEKTELMMRFAQVESELKKQGTEGKMEVESVKSRCAAEVSQADKETKVLQAEKEALTRELHRLQDEHDKVAADLSRCERELSRLRDQVDMLTHDKLKLEGELKSTQQTLDRTLQRMQRQSAASAAEINRLKNVQENILDTQLAHERQQRFHHQPQLQSYDADEADLHLEASKEKEEPTVENHALNRVKLLLQSIENDHRSRSPVK